MEVDACEADEDHREGGEGVEELGDVVGFDIVALTPVYFFIEGECREREKDGAVRFCEDGLLIVHADLHTIDMMIRLFDYVRVSRKKGHKGSKVVEKERTRGIITKRAEGSDYEVGEREEGGLL